MSVGDEGWKAEWDEGRNDGEDGGEGESEGRVEGKRGEDTYGVMRVSPISTMLARRTDRNDIIERLADRNTTVSYNTSVHQRQSHHKDEKIKEKKN